jgi:hypothetical protein
VASPVAITAAGRGGVALALPPELRALLRSVARQMREMLTDDAFADSPLLARLFPQAVMDDPLEALGFEQLMGDAIRSGKVESATVLEATADAQVLNAEETLAWLRCLNDVRLMLGTHLQVTEDPEEFEALLAEPETEQMALIYVAITELVEMLVRAVDPG